jgi:AraC-like DNA-binding protein
MKCSVLAVAVSGRWVEGFRQGLLPYLVGVEHVQHAKEAEQYINSGRYPLVVLDERVLSISRCRGVLPSRRRISIVVTLEKPSFDKAVEALRMGVGDVFVDPIDPEQLAARASVLLGDRVASPHYLCRKLDAFLEAHLADKQLKLANVSLAFGLSATYTSMLLRSGGWGGFRRRLAHHRVRAAKRLLVQTDTPLSRVADDCGFSSPSRLSEAFSRVVGITPKKYRQVYAHERLRGHQ